MSTRDDLAKRLAIESALDGPSDETVGDFGVRLANVVHAEGWRKIPSAEEVEAVVQRHWEAWTGRESQDFSMIVATSILALMDGGQ